MKKLLFILPLYFVASLQAECQSCNAPRARGRVQKYKNRESYEQVRERRQNRRVVQPMIETQPARMQQPQVMDMIDLQDVIVEQPKPSMQMMPTPQAKAPQPIAQKPAAVAMADGEVIRAKIHEGVNQTNYTASIGKSGALVHVVETKPVEATLSGKMIVPQVVDGQLQQKERPLSPQEAQMYHQKIKAAAAA